MRFQSAVNYITAAWRKRAKKWGDVLLDKDNKNNRDVSYRFTIDVAVFLSHNMCRAAGAC